MVQILDSFHHIVRGKYIARIWNRLIIHATPMYVHSHMNGMSQLSGIGGSELIIHCLCAISVTSTKFGTNANFNNCKGFLNIL